MQTERTILGFDFGTKSIGVAIAQEVTGTAFPLNALKARDGIPNWDQVEVVYTEWKPDLVVVGLPLNMDGSEQHLTNLAKKFGNRLHARYKVPVEFNDERLTTASAKEKLFELGGFKKLQKGKIDSVSACLILESWLEKQY